MLERKQSVISNNTAIEIKTCHLAKPSSECLLTQSVKVKSQGTVLVGSFCLRLCNNKHVYEFTPKLV